MDQRTKIMALTFILASLLTYGIATSWAAVPLPGKYEFTVEGDPTSLQQTLESLGTFSSENIQWSTTIKDPTNNNLDFGFNTKSVKFWKTDATHYNLRLGELKEFSFKYRLPNNTNGVEVLISAKKGNIVFTFSENSTTLLPMLDINGIFEESVVFKVNVLSGLPFPFPIYTYTGPKMEVAIHVYKPEMPVGKWEITLPGDYETAKGQFMQMFPEIETTNLHYSNPNLGPPGGPYATLTLDVGYLKANTGPGETLHLEVKDLKIMIEQLSIPGSTADYLEIAANDAVLDIELHPPDPEIGEFGTITATLNGNVKFHIPKIPGVIDGCDYEGPEFNAKITLVEPPPKNGISVESRTEQMHFMNGDSFTSSPVNGSRSWVLSYENQWDDTHDIVQNMNLTVETTETFDWVSPEGLTITDGTYIWSFGDLGEGWRDERRMGSMGKVTLPELFTPPFDVTRSTDPANMTSSGPQILKISITPKTKVDKLNVNVFMSSDENFEAYIKDAIGNADSIKWDGKNMWADIGNAEPGKIYNFTVKMHVELKPGVPWIRHMPAVQVVSQQFISSGSSEGDSIELTMPDLGNVNWSATPRDVPYQWNWRESNVTGVNLNGYASTNMIWVNFNMVYENSTGADEISNSWIYGSRRAHTHMHNVEDGTSLPVLGANLTFTTGLKISWVGTQQNLTLPNPIPSFPWIMTPDNSTLKWEFGDVAVDTVCHGDVAVYQNDLATDIGFYPGFDANRSFNDTTFETEKEGQTVTITVIPREPMDTLRIGVETKLDQPELIDATIISTNATILPDNQAGYDISSDGKFVSIWVQNPIIGQKYVYNVTIIVATLTDSNIEYKPCIYVSSESSMANSRTGGSGLSRDIPNVGVWTWAANGEYLWNWNESISKSVKFCPLIEVK